MGCGVTARLTETCEVLIRMRRPWPPSFPRLSVASSHAFPGSLGGKLRPEGVTDSPRPLDLSPARWLPIRQMANCLFLCGCPVMRKYVSVGVCVICYLWFMLDIHLFTFVGNSHGIASVSFNLLSSAQWLLTPECKGTSPGELVKMQVLSLSVLHL